MSAAHEFVEFTYAEAIAIAQRNMQENCPSVSRVFLARIAELEAALLAKSAEYDALVARVEVAPIVAVAIGYPNGYADTDIEIECYPEDFDRIVAINGQRVRLLVSDDRPSTVREK